MKLTESDILVFQEQMLKRFLVCLEKAQSIYKKVWVTSNSTLAKVTLIASEYLSLALNRKTIYCFNLLFCMCVFLFFFKHLVNKAVCLNK